MTDLTQRRRDAKQTQGPTHQTWLSSVTQRRPRRNAFSETAPWLILDPLGAIQTGGPECVCGRRSSRSAQALSTCPTVTCCRGAAAGAPHSRGPFEDLAAASIALDTPCVVAAWRPCVSFRSRHSTWAHQRTIAGREAENAPRRCDSGGGPPK